MLVAALRPQKLVEGAISPLTQAMEVGTGRTFTAPRDGVLYFKINEAASGLSDNDGELQVTISEGSE